MAQRGRGLLLRTLAALSRDDKPLPKTMSTTSANSRPRRAQTPRGRGDRSNRPPRGAGPPFSTGSRGRGQFEPHRSRGRGQGRPRGAIFMQDRPAIVDARIKDGSDMAVVAQLNAQRGAQAPASTIGTDQREEDAGPGGLPLRPGFGTQGKPIALRANYFPVQVQGTIYRYSLAIALSGANMKLTRRVKHRVFQLAEGSEEWHQANMPGHVAHDSAEKLVASIQLPQPLVIRGPYHNEDENASSFEGTTEYTLTVTFEEEVDQTLLNECLAGVPVDSQALAKVLSALNLVLTAQPSQAGVKIGRGDETKKHPDQRLFFDVPEPKDIDGGLTVREGFYVSVRPAHRQLMVNVNTCHAAFYKPQNFADALEEYRKFVRGGTGPFGHQVRVTTRPNNNIVMIQGIFKENAREHKFKHSQFGVVTIEKYYELKHNIKLERPDLPLLQGPNGSRYPPEVCDILTDQGFKGELTDSRHAKAMLDEACKRPDENANEIVHLGIDKLGFRDPNPVLESFGINVGTDMAVVPGRVLDKPGVSYLSRVPAAINDGASWNLRDVRFTSGARLGKWAVLVIQDDGRYDFLGSTDPELRKITAGFSAMCKKCGMGVQSLVEHAYAEVRLPHRGINRFRDDAIDRIEQVLRDLMARAQPELVLVMLSDDDKAIYNGLKWLCDVRLDLPTVCMQASKVRKPEGQPQYFANVALKVNMKLGGINHTLDANSGTWLKSAPTMIMGMDVTHPARGVSMDGTPSILAVVASVDRYFAQYPGALAMRKSKVEIERDQDSGDNVLRDMFISRFELFQVHNKGQLPRRVILYRDGVSESQFVQVRQYELKELKRAFQHFGAYEPKLSIVVCGKRHHTRFYPTQSQDATTNGNPLPGTVVDRGVTPAYEFDFFLQAHAGLKGTARPTHYFVVHDENGFTADDLQRVTLDLSYMFARATKAVSLVSPAYWADVACERGRCYLYKLLHGDKDGAGVATGKGKGKTVKGKQRAKEEETMFEKAEAMWGNGVSGPRLRDTMFYL